MSRPEIRHIADLKPDPRNARRHGMRNIGMIEDALHEVGAGRSIVIDEDGTILAGNGVVEAAASAGIERVQVVDADGETIVAVRRSGLTPEQKQRLALYDNRAAELAEWDPAVLAAIAQESPEAVKGMWSPEELAALIGEDGREVPEDPGAQVDRAEELREKWQTARGQIWQVGRHRLMCGDCCDPQVIDQLIAGQQLDMVLTDPPYNVGKEYGEHDDEMAQAEYVRWCTDWFTRWRAIVKWCIALTPGITNVPMWIADIERTHKIMAWLKENQNSRNYIGTTSGFNVWEPILIYGQAMKCVGHDAFSMPIALQADTGDHPCPKAIDAWKRLVTDLTSEGAVVGDPFLGSGSTMVACEQLGRICYATELEPKYVAVALERMAGLGLSPRLLEG